jgi:hypothetical protein
MYHLNKLSYTAERMNSANLIFVRLKYVPRNYYETFSRAFLEHVQSRFYQHSAIYAAASRA